jgi:putative transposase
LTRSAMSLPRQIIPGCFYKITRRTMLRQFLLRPDEETNNTYTYCLAVAAAQFEIEIIMTNASSNHHHTDIFDRHGNVIEFIQHFHKLFAKAQNAYLGRSENLWSSEPPSIVRYEDPERILDGLVYTATNPVKDGLVARVDQWPGVNSLDALLEKRTLKATRPAHFFRDDGPMPEVVELELVIPPELGDPEEVLQALKKRVAAAEESFEKERALLGQRVLGRTAVLRQSPFAAPKSVAPHGGAKPRSAASSLWRRLETLGRDRGFLEAYRRARALWIAGLDALFPFGTYWVCRFAGAPCAPAPS